MSAPEEASVAQASSRDARQHAIRLTLECFRAGAIMFGLLMLSCFQALNVPTPVDARLLAGVFTTMSCLAFLSTCRALGRQWNVTFLEAVRAGFLCVMTGHSRRLAIFVVGSATFAWLVMPVSVVDVLIASHCGAGVARVLAWSDETLGTPIFTSAARDRKLRSARQPVGPFFSTVAFLLAVVIGLISGGAVGAMPGALFWGVLVLFDIPAMPQPMGLALFALFAGALLGACGGAIFGPIFLAARLSQWLVRGRQT